MVASIAEISSSFVCDIYLVSLDDCSSSQQMSRNDSKTILLGLGNDILGDDGAGIVAVGLPKRFVQKEGEIVEAPVSSLKGLKVSQFPVA